MVQRKSFDLYLAWTAGMLSGARRVAMLLMLLLTMTAQTAWADTDLVGSGGDVTITVGGTYNVSGEINNLNITADDVTLNVGNLTINGTITGDVYTLNVSDGSSLTVTGDMIQVPRFNMTGGQVHVNNMEIMAECTISGGTISAQILTIHHGTISGGTINTNNTFHVNGEVTINAANSSLSITANFVFLEGFGSITITNGSLTDGTNEYSGTITEISTSGETTLTPVNTITVTLDAQGGSGGTTSVEATPNVAMPSITPPSWTGYIFGGYFTQTNGGGEKYYNADGSCAKEVCDLTTATTLYAQWIASTTCTVTLDHQNGTATTSVTATNGVCMPSVTPPTKTGYTFGGYFTETNGGGTQYYYADGTSAKNCDFTHATTLYAKWTAHTYYINFYGNGSTSGGMFSQYFTYDAEPQALSANQYVRAFTVTYNYNGATGGNSDASTTATATFNGWATSADGEKVYDDGQSVSNLTSGYSIALYAKWTDASITLPTPTKTGFAFDGWYSDAECNTLVGGAGSSYTPGSDMTLYAKWKKLLSHSDISVDIPAQTYNGNELTPVVTVKDGGVEVSDEHYDIILPGGRTNAGGYTIDITAKAGSAVYAGEISPTFTINPKSVTITGITVDDKTYDGTTTATLNADNATVNDKVGEDNVTVNIGNAAAVFTDANAGTGKTVTITGVAFGGDKAGNYTLASQPTGVTGNITPKALTVTANPKTITYGDEAVNDGVTYSGFVDGEDESVLGGTLGYDYDYAQNEPVGTYTITPKGLTSSNYAITFASGTLTVAPRVTGYGCLTYEETGDAATSTIELDGNSTTGLALTASITGVVSFNRSFTANKKATICLPFALTAAQKNALGTFYQFGGLKEGTTDIVTMQALGTDVGLDANTAYIIEPTADIGPIDFGQQTIAASPLVIASTSGSNDEFSFQGTYSLITWTESHADLGSVYCFVGLPKDGYELGQFAKVGRNTTCKPFRAYLKYNGELSGTEVASARRKAATTLPDVINIEWVSTSGETTGVSTLDTRTGEITDGAWYSLDGRKLNGNPTKKGLYINNGKKVVIK